MKVPAAVLFLLAAAGPVPALARGLGGSVYLDAFSGTGFLGSARHVVLDAEGGLTMDPAEQVRRFGGARGSFAGSTDAGCSTAAGPKGDEELVLWQKVLVPGRD